MNKIAVTTPKVNKVQDLAECNEYFLSVEHRLRSMVSKEREKDLITIMEEFWKFLTSIDNEVLILKIENEERFEECWKYLKDKWHEYISLIEINIANRFLESENKLSNSQPPSALSEEDYIGVDKELSILDKNLTGCTILMVGCGPFPETLIDIYKYNPNINNAIGIEKRNHIAKLANKVITEIFSKADKIDVLVSNAELFDYGNADIIFLANGLIGKNAILRQIYKTSPMEVSILIRNPILIGSMLYEDIFKTESIGLFNVCGSVKASKLSNTLLLKKIPTYE